MTPQDATAWVEWFTKGENLLTFIGVIWLVSMAVRNALEGINRSPGKDFTVKLFGKKDNPK